MAALTLGGVPVRVRKGTWRRLPNLIQGGRSRMRDNSAVSTEDPATEIRQFECEIFFITDAEEAAVEGACPKGTAVPVGGYLPPAALSALVDLNGGVAIGVKIGGVDTAYRTRAVHIEEAQPV
jgi:hypothetical protein